MFGLEEKASFTIQEKYCLLENVYKGKHFDVSLFMYEIILYIILCLELYPFEAVLNYIGTYIRLLQEY